MISKQNLLSLFRFNGKASPIGDADSAIISRVLSARVTVGGQDMEVPIFDAQALYQGDTTQIESLQDLLGVRPGSFYSGLHHVGTSTPQLATTISSDGINFVRTGKVNPYILPAGEGARDPDRMYHAASKSFVATYTHTTPGGDGYDNKLGLAISRDGITYEHVTDIAINGTGVTVAIVWNGSIVQESGRIIFTLLPMPADTNRQTPGIGWIEVQNPLDDPEDWTFSNFTAFRATNPNFNSSFSLNDVTIRKEGNTYYLFCDGYTAGGPSGPPVGNGAILVATSSSLLTGYSTLASTGIEISYEGPIGPVQKPEGGWRMYTQLTFAELQYSDASTMAGPWSAPLPVNWAEPAYLGNGGVTVVNTLDEQAALLLAPSPLFAPRIDEAGYVGWTLPVSADHLTVKLHMPRSGNGSTTGREVLSLFADGDATSQKGMYVLGQLIVSNNLIGADIYGTAITSTGRVDAAGYFNSTGVTNQIHYYFVTGSASHPAFKPVNASLQVRLGDDSNFAATQTLYERFGSGSPEGAVAAPVGAVYHRTDGGANTSLYIKQTGTTTNSGWTAVTP